MLQLIQLDDLTARRRVAADPLQLQLGSGQELERVIVQRAGKTATGLVAAGRDVVEEVPARGHRLLEPHRRVTQLVLGFLVLPDEAGRDPHHSEHPQVTLREPVFGVVDGHGADPPLAGGPGGRDRAPYVDQSGLPPDRVERG